MPFGWKCRGCGYTASTPWKGACPRCHRLWDCQRYAGRDDGPLGAVEDGVAISLADVENEDVERIETGISSLDEALGGGLVRGASVLLGGAPGAGKSTLVMDALLRIAAKKRRTVLYVSGEEKPIDLRRRAERLTSKLPPQFLAFAERDADAIRDEIEESHPLVAVIDSIQLVEVDYDLTPGSAACIEAATDLLRGVAGSEHCALVIIAHVTKDASLAGPKRLEHMVDTSLLLDFGAGDERVLSVAKNRHGRAPLTKKFCMTDKGLVSIADEPARGAA